MDALRCGGNGWPKVLYVMVPVDMQCGITFSSMQSRRKKQEAFCLWALMLHLSIFWKRGSILREDSEVKTVVRSVE